MLSPAVAVRTTMAPCSPARWSPSTGPPAAAGRSRLFSAVPAERRPGYANFALDDPALKLVLIESPGFGGSLNHLGVEVTSTAEVIAATRRLAAAGLPTQVEEGTTCCYAPQDKVWATGPGGERWEVYTVLADGGGDGTDVGEVPSSSPPPRPAAPLPPAHRPHGRSAAQAERASATDAAGGTGPFSLRSRPTVWAMRRWERGCWSRRRGAGGHLADVGSVPAAVGEHGVDLPALPARPGGPHLVLRRIAAGGALLDLGRQPRRGEPAGGGDALRGGSDLHAPVSY